MDSEQKPEVLEAPTENQEMDKQQELQEETPAISSEPDGAQQKLAEQENAVENSLEESRDPEQSPEKSPDEPPALENPVEKLAVAEKSPADESSEKDAEVETSAEKPADAEKSPEEVLEVQTSPEEFVPNSELEAETEATPEPVLEQQTVKAVEPPAAVSPPAEQVAPEPSEQPPTQPEPEKLEEETVKETESEKRKEAVNEASEPEKPAEADAVKAQEPAREAEPEKQNREAVEEPAPEKTGEPAKEESVPAEVPKSAEPAEAVNEAAPAEAAKENEAAKETEVAGTESDKPAAAAVASAEQEKAEQQKEVAQPQKEPELPLFFGWLLLPEVQERIKCYTMDFLKTLDTLEAFKKHLSDFTGEAEKTLDLEQYFEAKGPLHCTAKYCDYGKAEGAKEYAEEQVVKESYGGQTELSVTALFVTPRTFGARVALTEEQLKLWPTGGDTECLPPTLTGVDALPVGSRAHVTLGCSASVEPVQTGFDLLEILLLKQGGQEGTTEEEMELGTLSYLGQGRWYLALREAVTADATFSSYSDDKRPSDQTKKEGEKKKKVKCTIL
ncbi:fibrous sheath CABYR-binding protein [Chanos chanos]|uniref:Fibrous sheath CABYR-binding protein n=1 Tax=Chanos chanos TaxID=29144 RepID=A0A6J2WYU0_CHACN|nr:2',3'-cyclic-nucleotide 3'-phosphodiesterase [Chanos chanos]